VYSPAAPVTARPDAFEADEPIPSVPGPETVAVNFSLARVSPLPSFGATTIVAAWLPAADWKVFAADTVALVP